MQKFLALNGPSGWYSHFCTSRADQSLTITQPKSRSSARSTGMRSPSALAAPPRKMPISSSWSSSFDGPKDGGPSSLATVCPCGRRTGVPSTTMVDDRPWYPTGRCFQLGISGWFGRNMLPTFVAWCSLA